MKKACITVALLAFSLLVAFGVVFFWYRAYRTREYSVGRERAYEIRNEFERLNRSLEAYLSSEMCAIQFDGNSYVKYGSGVIGGGLPSPIEEILKENRYSLYFLNPRLKQPLLDDVYSASATFDFLWLLHCEGLDRKSDLNLMTGRYLPYDPTNGVFSAGDIVRIGAVEQRSN